MWTSNLQAQYRNKREFVAFDEMYSLSLRLGYRTAKEAWSANPVIQGSTNPRDYKVVDLADWEKVEDGWFVQAAGENLEVHLRLDDELGYGISVLFEAVPTKPAEYHTLFADAIAAANNVVLQLIHIH